MAKATYDSDGLTGSFSKSSMNNQFHSLFQGDGSALRPRAQAAPNMTIAVSSGLVQSYFAQIWLATTGPVSYAGGNSSSISAPSANPRIDLLYLNSSEALAWITGTEAAAPTEPSFTEDGIPICFVYCRTTMTTIVNYEDKDANPTQGYIYKDIRPNFANAAGGGTPIGSMMMWPTNTAPTGWLLCYGQAVSRTTYASLFTVISTTFGVGDGSTTFNMPDLRGRVPLGKDDMGGVSADRVTESEADILGSSEGDENGVASHIHAMNGAFFKYDGDSGGGFSNKGSGVNTSSQGTSSGNLPPYITFNYIMKI